MGWNITIIDGDGHRILDRSNTIVNSAKPIIIGDHVWIASNVTILKGSYIPNNCIVGANTVVSKAFDEDNTIIAGNPAKVVKHNINWKL